MANLMELAKRRVLQNGLNPREAALMLEAFARGTGRDIGWEDIAPYLTRPLIGRIDQAAVDWCMAHRLTGNIPPETQAELDTARRERARDAKGGEDGREE